MAVWDGNCPTHYKTMVSTSSGIGVQLESRTSRQVPVEKQLIYNLKSRCLGEFWGDLLLSVPKHAVLTIMLLSVALLMNQPWRVPCRSIWSLTTMWSAFVIMVLMISPCEALPTSTQLRCQKRDGESQQRHHWAIRRAALYWHQALITVFITQEPVITWEQTESIGCQCDWKVI